jgi:hypothetical protein
MQGAVHDQVGIVGDQRNALVGGLAAQDRTAQHEVGDDDRLAFVIEGQHVGGVVLAPELAIECLPFCASTTRTVISAGRSSAAAASAARDAG